MTTDFPYLDLKSYFAFPPVAAAGKEGIVGWGGNLSPGMLFSAYRQGIFPWFSEGEPVIWWSPDPRFVLRPEKIHISKSLRKFLRSKPFEFSTDMAFREVICACSSAPRPEQDGTWITDDMVESYCKLHELGIAHSIEVWSEGTLVGGLYGVAVGSVFTGESMFRRVDNASRAALTVLAFELSIRKAPLIDCQLQTDHLENAGGESISRESFLEVLKGALLNDCLEDLWSDSTHFGDSFYDSI